MTTPRRRASAAALTFLACTLVAWPAADAQAQRGGSSSSSGGGRSSFSGGASSSGGRSSFSGGSSGGGRSSVGGGGRSSFSGGSSKPPASPGPSKPAAAYSGGSSSPAKPATSSGSSSSSFSGVSSKPRTTTTTAPVAGRTPKTVSEKPKAPSFDKLAGDQAKSAESRANYAKSEKPAETYKTPKGEAKPVNQKDPEVAYLRGRLDERRWADRPTRITNFYGGFSGPAYPVVAYGDPFHPMWNYYLLSRVSADLTSLWIYHHVHSLDQARLNDLYARNAELRDRVARLEAQKVPRDPAYALPDVDPDVSYNDGWVEAVYNPTPKTVTEYEYDEDGGGSSGWSVLGWVCGVTTLLALVGLGVWALFFHRW